MNLITKIIIIIILLSIEAILIYRSIKHSYSKKEAVSLTIMNIMFFLLGFILSKFA